MTERKMIEEKDVEQALDVLQRYWVGKDLRADNSILREEVRDWVRQAIPMAVEGVTPVFSAKDLKDDYIKVLTNEEKGLIDILGHGTIYSSEYIEEWINRKDDVQVNVIAALSAMGAKGFYDCIRCCVRQNIKPESLTFEKEFIVKTSEYTAKVKFYSAIKAMDTFGSKTINGLEAVAEKLCKEFVAGTKKRTTIFMHGGVQDRDYRCMGSMGSATKNYPGKDSGWYFFKENSGNALITFEDGEDL